MTAPPFPPRTGPRVLGLMSGTSTDGIDAVLTELPGWPALWSGSPPPPLTGDGPRVQTLAHHHTPYPDDLRRELLAAARDELPTSALAVLHHRLGAVLAGACLPLAAHADLIASHGQTVSHRPPHATLQIGEAAVIVERTGLPVVADFRPADLAAGGEAAPLVPFADRLMYAAPGVRRAVHNLGGISNVTYLPGLDASGVLAFDTGPANTLIDEVAALHGLRYDDGARLALSGTAHEALVQAWLTHQDLLRPPPKSTGRERWHLAALPGREDLSVPDLAATVTAFSAASVVDAYRRFVLPLGLDEVLVAGGGARNPLLMRLIREGLAPVPVLTFEERGLDAMTREAAAFAVLGYFAAQGWANTLPGTTGARHAVVAGKLSRPAPPTPTGGHA
ncbi:anhydro-N-acetylmuramic acid kinase [Deinococcus aquiradiocola]|uniref:Anhydro-N-acetylmuramic acid kinase n=1 Tax=Deinococcus aquiradiocola TaxID=393059 RepID=A0A917PCB8_9DEIO|nr:anhydro-N-acetylmuramic acid kinase [Deinococcus aquiradiocola]GGJ70375.1 anhydro-N-acetylmuramic acid kinase [Deinococcus aquiradiocola]